DLHALIIPGRCPDLSLAPERACVGVGVVAPGNTKGGAPKGPASLPVRCGGGIPRARILLKPYFCSSNSASTTSSFFFSPPACGPAWPAPASGPGSPCPEAP